jgi:hypothetical protein
VGGIKPPLHRGREEREDLTQSTQRKSAEDIRLRREKRGYGMQAEDMKEAGSWQFWVLEENFFEKKDEKCDFFLDNE